MGAALAGRRRAIAAWGLLSEIGRTDVAWGLSSREGAGLHRMGAALAGRRRASAAWGLPSREGVG
jgi:hypothetical protein